MCNSWLKKDPSGSALEWYLVSGSDVGTFARNAKIWGSSYDDFLELKLGNEAAFSLDGADEIIAGEGADLVRAENGSDTIYLFSSDIFSSGFTARNTSTDERISLEGMKRYSSVIHGGEM